MRPPLQPAPPDMEARPCTPPVTKAGPQRLRQTPTRQSTRAASQAYWACVLPRAYCPAGPGGAGAEEGEGVSTAETADLKHRADRGAP